MLRDCGSRDAEFIELVKEIRSELLRIAGTSASGGYEAIPMQGSGTFAIESTIGSVVPEGGRLLVLVNGAYGDRILSIARRLGIDTAELRCPEDKVHDGAALRAALTEDVTHVALVHCETTSGILNPIEEHAAIIKDSGKVLIVDAMSSFGGYPTDVPALGIDFLVSSSNKCIQGVPGFGFVIARREALEATRGNARSVSLDLLAQWEALEANGQFRFTPPTHVLLAFAQALRELEAEGGVTARAARYRSNNDMLISGMQELGYEPYVHADLRSHIITTFRFPSDDFDFVFFYDALAERGHVIYPGKLTEVDCFRIGNIGELGADDVAELLAAIAEIGGR